jgi:glycosyltransferase involved in cell wall biosynthesis
MMHILLIHQYYLEQGDFGGSRFNEMTKVWLEHGHKVTVIAGMMHANGSSKRPEYKRRYVVDNDQNGVRVIRCHVSEGYNKNFLGRFFGYLSFMIWSAYAAVFKAREKYDAVLVTSPPLFVGLSGIFISFLKRIPFVFEIRDLWPESAIDSGVLENSVLIKLSYFSERFIYKKADLINVLTPAFRDNLIQKKGIRRDKIIYIPNACDFILSDKVMQNHTKRDLRESFGWTDKVVFTYVGAHGVANHLEQVIDAMKLVDDDRIIFNLIGSGMQKEALMARAKNLGVTNVVFIDPVPKEEVFKYIIASDFGASVLKKVDTFKTIYSNKTFDYMSCKTPVLLLIDGISKDLIERAKCGFYAEPENTTEIIRIINKCAALSQTEILKMGEAGYDYASKHFDRTKLAVTYISLIEDKVC